MLNFSFIILIIMFDQISKQNPMETFVKSLLVCAF